MMIYGKTECSPRVLNVSRQILSRQGAVGSCKRLKCLTFAVLYLNGLYTKDTGVLEKSSWKDEEKMKKRREDGRKERKKERRKEGRKVIKKERGK